jgi:hypothetical protein
MAASRFTAAKGLRYSSSTLAEQHRRRATQARFRNRHTRIATPHMHETRWTSNSVGSSSLSTTEI